MSRQKALLGAAFLAIGLWAWAEKATLFLTATLSHSSLSQLFYSFLSLTDVWLSSSVNQFKFSVFLGLIFFLELTAGILAFVFKDWIKDQLNFFIYNNVKAYRDDIDLQNLIDFAQEYWLCCGAHGPDDWNQNIYFNCTKLNPSRERCGVPFSCCIKDPSGVLNTQCGYDVRLEAVSTITIITTTTTISSSCLLGVIKLVHLHH
ncbi:tetraspanin-17 [Silurus meridionalis]|nr:tetraspanin-17 [Silurus meridionalis]